MKQRRVLLVTNVFPPAIGGPATFSVRLAKQLAARGWRVRVLCATPSGRDGDAFEFQVLRIGILGNRIRRELEIRAAMFHYARWAHVVYCMGLEEQAAWACARLGRPLVLRIGGDRVWEDARKMGVTCREPAAFYLEGRDDEHQPVSVPASKRRRQFAAARAVIFVSEYLRSLACHWGVKVPVDQRVVPNGIDSTDGDGIADVGNGDGPLRLLFVGRQMNWKGVDLALLALAQVPNATFTVAGSGPGLPANVDLARRLGLADRVRFVGHVTPSEIPSLMLRHQLLVLPSLYEGLSNTLLEAGLAGLVCIASDRAGNPEVICSGRTGILVDPYDADALADRLRTLGVKPSLRQRLASSHRRRVLTEFSIERTVSSTMEVLESVC